MTARELEALVLRTTDVLTNLDAVNASMTRQQYEELENISQKIGFVCNYPNKFPYLNKLYGELAVFLSMVEPTRYGYTYDVEIFFSCTGAIIQDMNEMRRECYKL